jgi:dienelactone hydrolase
MHRDLSNTPYRFLASLLLLALAGAAPGQGVQPQPAAPNVVIPPPRENDPIRIGSPLVIGKMGSSQRAIIAPDAIGERLVAGTWQAPRPGNPVALRDGTTRTWEAASFDDKGLLKSEGYASGYAYVPVEAAEDEVLLLTATGHSAVYINGEARVGDPYRTGFVRLPVLLRKGTNHLLFRGGRGDELRVGLRAVLHGLTIDPFDATLPDLVVGATGTYSGAVVVVNGTNQWQRGWTIAAGLQGGQALPTPVAAIPPLGVTKVPFSFDVRQSPAAGSVNLMLSLTPDPAAGGPQNTSVLKLRVRGPEESRKVTFVSGIDGSVQYYAVRPISGGTSPEGQALILTLHGASVEATSQADAYSPKPWCTLVAPTNRRPFGFDWEDWGRLDAIEVLDRAVSEFKPDPSRVYLTGHSMGGHGTWQIGAHFPGRFAAIAPSAGWISFWSYSGAAAYSGGTPVEAILRRAVSASDTLELKDNYKPLGVYVLHGDADDNVPVEQARRMRKELGEFHPDFAYYERPSAGHWWGNECVDWPPLMEFLKRHARTPAGAARSVRFTTANPGISAWCDWAGILAQVEPMRPSTIDLKVDPATRAVSGKTENVLRLALDLSSLAAPVGQVAPMLEAGKPINLEIDGQKLSQVPWPEGQSTLWLERAGETWGVVPRPAPTLKGPHRSGLFKDAFRNNVLLVVGTGGSNDENALLLAKARNDAEVFWYRGNGSLQIVTDRDFGSMNTADRNVVLYGNAVTNAAWKALLADSPIQVDQEGVTVGGKRVAGDALACLFIRPRPGSDTASVGVVAGTGISGIRLAGRVPYFSSGVAVPDWIVLGPEAMTEGVGGVRGAGFFGNAWELSPADSAWSERSAELPAKD